MKTIFTNNLTLDYSRQLWFQIANGKCTLTVYTQYSSRTKRNDTTVIYNPVQVLWRCLGRDSFAVSTSRRGCDKPQDGTHSCLRCNGLCFLSIGIEFINTNAPCTGNVKTCNKDTTERGKRTHGYSENFYYAFQTVTVATSAKHATAESKTISICIGVDSTVLHSRTCL